MTLLFSEKEIFKAYLLHVATVAKLTRQIVDLNVIEVNLKRTKKMSMFI